MAGPYCRLESPTQTTADAVQQVNSGEIWGRAIKGGGLFLCVKAYRRSLRHPPERGINFDTPIPHDPRYSTPYEARWYYPQTNGVLYRTNANNEDFAAIPANVTNLQP